MSETESYFIGTWKIIHFDADCLLTNPPGVNVQDQLDSNQLKIELKIEEDSVKWTVEGNDNIQSPLFLTDGYSVSQSKLTFIDSSIGFCYNLSCEVSLIGEMKIKLNDTGKKVLIVLRNSNTQEIEFSLEPAINSPDFFYNEIFSTKDARSVHAHKEVLSVRCPIILTKEGKTILEKYNLRVVKALLVYLYSDQIPDDSKDILNDIKQLASQLKIDRLEYICQTMSKKFSLKEEIEQNMKRIQNSVHVISELTSSNFVESYTTLRNFIIPLMTEVSIIALSLTSILKSYGTRKSELSKEEKKSYKESVRKLVIELINSLNSDFTKIGRKVELVPEQTMIEMLEDLTPTFSQYYRKGIEILEQAKQVLETSPTSSHSEKATSLQKLLGYKKIKLKKIKKSFNTFYSTLSGDFFQFTSAGPEEQAEMFSRYMNDVIKETFFRYSAREDVRERRVKKAIQLLHPFGWKEAVKSLSPQVVYISKEMKKNKEQVENFSKTILQNTENQVLRHVITELISEPDTQINIEEESKKYPGTLKQDIKKLLNQEGDMFFLVENRKIRAHRSVVSSRSKYFRTVFSSGMREATERVIEIKDVSYELFNIVMEHLYGGTNLYDVEVNSMIDLIDFCDLYDIQDLKSQCEQQIKDHVDIENATVLFAVSSTRELTNLKNFCVEFIYKNKGSLAHETYDSLDQTLKDELFAYLKQREYNGVDFPRESSSYREDSDNSDDGIDSDSEERHYSPLHEDENHNHHIENQEHLEGETSLVDRERLEQVMEEILVIVGEDADRELLENYIVAADYDQERAINYFFSAM